MKQECGKKRLRDTFFNADITASYSKRRRKERKQCSNQCARLWG